MGTGTNVAVESVGITPLKGDAGGPRPQSSRAPLGNIRQNLFFAFAYKSVGVPIAAEVLYPVTGLMLSPHARGAGAEPFVSARHGERAQSSAMVSRPRSGIVTHAGLLASS